MLLTLMIAGGAAGAGERYVIVDGSYAGREVDGGNGAIKRGDCAGAYFAGKIDGRDAPSGPCGYGRVVLLPATGQLRNLADAITLEVAATKDEKNWSANLQQSVFSLTKLQQSFDKDTPAHTRIATIIAEDLQVHSERYSPHGLQRALSLKLDLLNDLIERGIVELPKDEFTETTAPHGCEQILPGKKADVCIGTGDPTIHYMHPGGRVFHPKVESVVDYLKVSLGTNARPAGATMIDDKLWVTDFNNCKIEVILDGKVINAFSVTPGSGPSAIAAGPEGSVWWTGQGNDTLGVRSSSGTISYLKLPARSQPQDITRVDTKMWATLALKDAVVSSSFRDFVLRSLSHPLSFPREITADQYGDVWFTEQGSNRIGRRKKDGTLKEYVLPAGQRQPTSIVSAYEQVWFTTLSGQLDRISRSGTITSWELPTPDAGASSIALAPDGLLAIVEANADKVAWFRAR